MAGHLINALKRRVYYLVDSQNSVVNFDVRTLKHSIELKLAELDRLAASQDSSFRHFTMQSISKSLIKKNLYEIYHIMNALRYKDPELHDRLAVKVDDYQERLKPRKG